MHRIPLIVLETIVLLVISITGIVHAVYLIRNPDPYGTYDKVGPGGFLLLISSLLTIASILNIIRYRKDLRGEKQGSHIKGNITKMFRLSILIVMFIFLIDITGFILASAVLVFFMTRLLGIRSWFKTTMVSIAISVSIYLIFVFLLNMDLPGGLLLEFIRGE